MKDIWSTQSFIGFWDFVLVSLLIYMQFGFLRIIFTERQNLIQFRKSESKWNGISEIFSRGLFSKEDLNI